MCWSQKWFFKNEKKYYFDVFLSEKHFEPQPQPHCETGYGPCHQTDSTIFHCLSLFESVVAVAFQSVFHLEIYQNYIFFIFLKFFLISMHQNIKKILKKILIWIK